jgi:hypothetical protein
LILVIKVPQDAFDVLQNYRWVRYNFKNDDGNTKWDWAKLFIEPLGGIHFSQRSAVNFLRVSRHLMSFVKNLWQGLHKPP